MRFSLSSLELAVGTATAGVTLGATKFDLVTLASGLVGDTRRWLLIDAAGVTGTLTLPGITGSITGLTLQVNRASGGGGATGFPRRARSTGAASRVRASPPRAITCRSTASSRASTSSTCSAARRTSRSRAPRSTCRR